MPFESPVYCVRCKREIAASEDYCPHCKQPQRRGLASAAEEVPTQVATPAPTPISASPEVTLPLPAAAPPTLAGMNPTPAPVSKATARVAGIMGAAFVVLVAIAGILARSQRTEPQAETRNPQYSVNPGIPSGIDQNARNQQIQQETTMRSNVPQMTRPSIARPGAPSYGGFPPPAGNDPTTNVGQSTNGAGATQSPSVDANNVSANENVPIGPGFPGGANATVQQGPSMAAPNASTGQVPSTLPPGNPAPLGQQPQAVRPGQPALPTNPAQSVQPSNEPVVDTEAPPR